MQSVSIGAVLALAVHSAGAAEPDAPVQLPPGIEACAQIRIDSERLACYDRYVAPKARGSAQGAVAAVQAPKPMPDREEYLDQFWELSKERKRGTFNFDGYRPTYFLPLHVTNGANSNATSPAPDHSGQLPDYRNVEAKLQISVRTKLYEGLGLRDADLWFGYSQLSLWQLYSGDISRPFRATDHEPELFYIVPARVQLPLGLKWQMGGIGIAHQSNGQSEPFSRSWNRWYLLAGLEAGEMAYTVRQNFRIHESDGKDDNPDFTRYRGRTELLALWSPGNMTLTGLVKTNFKFDRGSYQLDWSMPVSRKDPKGLRWYVQAFHGYAESLIEYNHRQTSFGLGVALFGW